MDIKAIDIEVVIGVSNKKMLAHVCVSTNGGFNICDSYILPTEPIKSYGTIRSEFRKKEYHKNGEPLSRVRNQLITFFQHTIVVGYNTRKMLRLLKIRHPVDYTRDVSQYAPFVMQNGHRKPTLRELTRMVFDFEYNRGEYDCMSNARLVLNIYYTVARQWEISLVKSILRRRG